MVKKTTILVGMKAIRQYVGRSEATVLKWIRDDGFPAKKVDGVWESDTVLIEKWRRGLIAGVEDKKTAAKKKTTVKKKSANQNDRK